MAGRSRSQRLEEKRHRREKRLDKKKQGHEEINKLIRALEVVDVPPPGNWPGAVDPSVARPDLVKFAIGTRIGKREPGMSKMRALEARFRRGPLGFLPEIEHWAMEEFIWHGIPGDSFLPVEAFLACEGDRFPPAAREQIRRWKEARLGAFEVGEVAGETVMLRPWDLLGSTPAYTFEI